MIEAFCGKLGHGKSFTQLERSLQLANKQNRFLVSNVPLNLEVLERYCWSKGYHRLTAMMRRGWVYFEQDFDRIMAYENAVILADELGIFMNSRDSVGKGAEKRKKFLSDLILSRKAGLDLCWVSQHMEMVDLNIRRLTNFYWHTFNTDPSKRFNPSRRRILLRFDAVGYENYLKDPGPLSYVKHGLDLIPEVRPFDPLLFGAYDTLHRLDNSKTFGLDQVAAELGGHVEGEPIRTYRGLTIVPKEYKPGEVGLNAQAFTSAEWNRRINLAKASITLGSEETEDRKWARREYAQ